ncbi:MAG: pyridoxamine 5'-phosphate oxidase family protein [Nitrospirae bacterium]|nr:pyridoxamine 5'-phosphate oxidase family protein [Nitrospirota bacterium]
MNNTTVRVEDPLQLAAGSFNNGKRIGTMKRKAMSRGGPIPVRTSKGNADVLARLKRLDRTQRHAVLATTGRTGPLVSLIAFVLTNDSKGVVFATPTSTAKYRNMRKDSKVSLLIDTRENNRRDYLKAEAMTIFGRAKEIKEGPQWAELATLLASKHKELEPFIAAPTTALIRVTISRCVHVGKFQEKTEWKTTKRTR